jgi:hypothetical protein
MGLMTWLRFLEETFSSASVPHSLLPVGTRVKLLLVPQTGHLPHLVAGLRMSGSAPRLPRILVPGWQRSVWNAWTYNFIGKLTSRLLGNSRYWKKTFVGYFLYGLSEINYRHFWTLWYVCRATHGEWYSAQEMSNLVQLGSLISVFSVLKQAFYMIIHFKLWWTDNLMSYHADVLSYSHN